MRSGTHGRYIRQFIGTTGHFHQCRGVSAGKAAGGCSVEDGSPKGRPASRVQRVPANSELLERPKSRRLDDDVEARHKSEEEIAPAVC
jgi:hypothetical protein